MKQATNTRSLPTPNCVIPTFPINFKAPMKILFDIKVKILELVKWVYKPPPPHYVDYFEQVIHFLSNKRLFRCLPNHTSLKHRWLFMMSNQIRSTCLIICYVFIQLALNSPPWHHNHRVASAYSTKGGFPCRPLAHHIMVGMRTKVDEIWWGSVHMSQPTIAISSI